MKIKQIPIIALLLWCASGCTPEFLDEKPRKSLVVPSTLEELQALLDNAANVMNQSPFLTLYADGDFSATQQGLNSENSVIRDIYLWAREPYQQGVPVYDWDMPYRKIFYANVVLEGLARLQDSEHTSELRGQALFFRALAHYELSQQFAPAYQIGNAQNTSGVVLKTSSDISVNVNRSNLYDSYQQIVEDLTQASRLLRPVASTITRPAATAAWALLSRVYLTMGDYPNSEHAARESLSINNILMDYNNLDTNAAAPFPNPFRQANPEILFFCMANTPLANSTVYRVDSALYETYEANDLRRVLFFDAERRYKGAYTGENICFTGLATDEVYLTIAECLARRGEIQEGADMLNVLLAKRFRRDSLPISLHESADELLGCILLERRKQLFGRGSRWSDLKRLNLGDRLAVTLRRRYQDVEYILPPKDLRYVFLIPEDEIQGSGILQNPR